QTRLARQAAFWLCCVVLRVPAGNMAHHRGLLANSQALRQLATKRAAVVCRKASSPPMMKQNIRSSSTLDAGDLRFAVPKVAAPSLAVAGSDRRFPVRRVYCVGSNYREHALEMGGNPDKDPPFFFTKPPDAAVDVSGDGAVVHYPPETEDLQHEVEMVVAIGKDMQRAAKKAGRPWDCSKGFDSSGPIGALTPVTEGGAVGTAAGAIDDEGARRIWLEVDGTKRQDSVLGEMVWSVPDMIARLSQLFTLEAGDVLFTGTPSGVAPLAVGEVVEARVEGLEACRFRVGPMLPPTQ
ncbi:unnamed protein product, partial [Scytosiphon promiscuus]